MNASDSLDRLSRIWKDPPHVVSSLPRSPANVFLLKDKRVIVISSCTHTKISTLLVVHYCHSLDSSFRFVFDVFICTLRRRSQLHCSDKMMMSMLDFSLF